LIAESRSPGQTEAAGRELAPRLAPGDIVLLEADLAAGKTTFVRGLVEGLGGDPEEVSSPTFVIVQTYETGPGAIARVHHVDLYRLAGASQAELRETGLEEVLSDDRAVVAVEWPVEAVVRWLPRGIRPWRVRIDEVQPRAARRIEIEAVTPAARRGARNDPAYTEWIAPKDRGAPGAVDAQKERGLQSASRVDPRGAPPEAD